MRQKGDSLIMFVPKCFLSFRIWFKEVWEGVKQDENFYPEDGWINYKLVFYWKDFHTVCSASWEKIETVNEKSKSESLCESLFNTMCSKRYATSRDVYFLILSKG